jgi:outer membrane beta-barrel protein
VYELRFVFCLAAVAAVVLGFSRPARAQCVDEALKEQLVGKRSYRGVVERQIQKALRHELSPMGGWYAADVSDGAPIYGGAYTFHFTEDVGLEASYLRTQQNFAFLRGVVDSNQGLVQITAPNTELLQYYMGTLVWSLAYGKVRWLGGAIGRFDFNVALGAGVAVEPGERGFTGEGGFGLKFYANEWLAIRLDARDYIRQMKRQSLGIEQIVNDVAVLGGLSVFIPFSN